MAWLRRHGLIANYDDRARLPATVLDDARLMMHAEAVEADRQRREAAGRG